MSGTLVSGGLLPPNVSSTVSSNVRKCGYLRKHKHGHRRFFVLKGQGQELAARLEYYESEKKWKNRSAPKRVIPLDSCLNINKRADAKHKHLIALYTKDEYFAVAADNELEQENWYSILTELMNEGKVYDGTASKSASSLVGFGEANYGVITPASAAYKEVWQVNLKHKGLGQTKNLTGVYRLCLSSRTVSFVKLNCEKPSVVLQLMNIRRCGHSDSFFFMEVGRSASTGPGELWMQADDSVVAQNIHETILEAMKAMKEMSEFRPRSKSQSSGTNPISVPTRRHLNNLPPSQTGLLRRSRTDSVATTSPVSKLTSCRIRAASEGDGTMTRPLSVNGNPVSPSGHQTLLSRSNTVTIRPCRIFESGVLQHSKSVSIPAPDSLCSAISPVSLSSSIGNSSAPTKRPASAGASISGSLSDPGFMSCEDCASSPGDMQYAVVNRSNTPESIADTPPSRDGISGYMLMERQPGSGCRWASHDDGLEKAYRKRTCSLTVPPQQRAPPQVSSTSLDEYTLMRATRNSGNSLLSFHTASMKISYPEDYGDIKIGMNVKAGDDGYMPMTPGVAPPDGGSGHYMPMSPMCVSAPKQIQKPRSRAHLVVSGYKTSPSSSSLDDSGYMKMVCGSKFSVENSDGKLANGEYMNMSPVDPCVSMTPPDYFFGGLNKQNPQGSYCFSSLPRSYKTQLPRNGDTDQYVVMNLHTQKILEEPSSCAITGKSPEGVYQFASLAGRDVGRIKRPTRLLLEAVRVLPSTSEDPLPTEPKSPGEYINIDFGEAVKSTPPSLSSSTDSNSSHEKSSISDYMNIDVRAQSSQDGDVATRTVLNVNSLSSPCQTEKEEYLNVSLPGIAKGDYTKRAFDMARGSSKLISEILDGSDSTSPSQGLQQLTLRDPGLTGLEAFLLSRPPVDPDKGAKVIRADPQGRRRHSSETFSSTTTVMPVFPSFANDAKRHNSASVENVSIWSSEGLDEDYGSPMCRETSAGFQYGLNYIALNLMDDHTEHSNSLVKLKTSNCCKGDISGVHATPFSTLGFKERVTVVKD